MSKHGHENASRITLDPSVIEIPPLANAKETGHREIARVWVKENTKDDTVVVQLRTPYDDVREWHTALVMFARTIAHMHSPEGTTPEEMDIAALKFMGEAFARYAGGLKIDIDDALPPRNPKDLITQFLEAVTKNEPGALEQALVAAQGEDILDIEHPGELPIPDDMMDDDNAQELLSIWAHPPVDECPGCGEDHAMETVIVGATSHVEPGDLGRILAEVVMIHCGETERLNAGKRLIMQGEIEKAFYTHLSEGIARA